MLFKIQSIVNKHSPQTEGGENAKIQRNNRGNNTTTNEQTT